MHFVWRRSSRSHGNCSARGVVVAFSLTAGLLVSGCSGDDSDLPVSSSKASASASADAQAAAVDTLIQAGLDQLAAGDVKAARGSFVSVLALDPDNALGHYNLGVIAQQAGRNDEALNSYDAALASDPTFAAALFNKGILMEPIDLEAAVDLYRLAVKSDDQRAAAFMRLGFALVHLGRKTAGEKALAEGLRLDPSMATVEAPRYD